MGNDQGGGCSAFLLVGVVAALCGWWEVVAFLGYLVLGGLVLVGAVTGILISIVRLFSGE